MPVEVTTLSGAQGGADAPCLRVRAAFVARRAHRDEPRERRRHEHPGERRHTHPR
ncbi:MULTISPECIES: hypothetical protein [Ralstonia solanacearum species complex]|uniref:Uncharacterized protein n=1 Tax=Ralstonia solanacearum IPO1609 TaxID=564066 RepID=A0A7U7JCW9_RALSL|nr:hypothetical protein [Ralstonia solanacearum]ALF91072.1 hypothetical protein RSUY_47700 [Ralstonia solanacearum]MDN4063093.1 hypothetical protein [Ralstonia solanacearum]CEJ16543.1 hypothetical protein RSIPO_03241 [Ralstonia solanacearum IPO1609]